MTLHYWETIKTKKELQLYKKRYAGIDSASPSVQHNDFIAHQTILPMSQMIVQSGFVDR
jgi:hypothetical protein